MPQAMTARTSHRIPLGMLSLSHLSCKYLSLNGAHAIARVLRLLGRARG